MIATERKVMTEVKDGQGVPQLFGKLLHVVDDQGHGHGEKYHPER
jgi:hypothetical protein